MLEISHASFLRKLGQGIKKMKYSSRDHSVVSVAYIGLVIAIVFIMVSILSIVAEIRHSRYALHSEGRDAVTRCVPYFVSLPCRAEQEAVYVAASKWVDACVRDGICTWITDETRSASLDGGTMYPWSRQMHFGYASTLPRISDDASIIVTRFKGLPTTLESCSIGILKQTLREPRRRRRLRIAAVDVTCKRRDFLDRFRFPMRVQDVFTTFVKNDDARRHA